MSEQLRWRVATALDYLPGMCWSELVEWALDGDVPRKNREKRLRDCRIDWVCRTDLQNVGSCYCARLCSPEFARQHLVARESRWPRTWLRRLALRRAVSR